MAYTKVNFKKKKELIETFRRGEKVEVYQPGPFGPGVSDGQVCIEGPHYPEAHRWYANATVKDGVIVYVK